MPISSQALQACKEGSETSWFSTTLLCNTTLASDILSLCEDDDIVQPFTKVSDKLNRLVRSSSLRGATTLEKKEASLLLFFCPKYALISLFWDTLNLPFTSSNKCNPHKIAL